MSFASECKEELMTIRRTVEENKALVLGMILSGAKIEEDSFTFSSTNDSITRYANFLLNKVYHIEGVCDEENLQSQQFLHSYLLKVENASKIIEDLEISHFGPFKDKIKSSQNLTAAYLCGAFLARGSVNDPNTSKYHFEITLEESKNAIFVQQIMNEYNTNAKIIKRRNKLVVYIKDAEKIVDVLRLMGVNKNAFHYEDIRIERDFNNSINRVINCEIANEQKAQTAAREQMRYIKYLMYNYPLEMLDPKLLTVMKVRMDNPEATLVELIQIFEEEYGQKISKPGLCHRFAKIKAIATEHYNSR